MDQSRRPIRLGLVGVGKIARDQHIPAIRADARFTLVATASRDGHVEGLPAHPDIAALIAAGHDLDAIAICTPPAGRHVIAAEAITAGLHVLVEKPPCATLAEIADLTVRAEQGGTSLFAAWHSREAAGVAPARDWLTGRTIRRAAITWREDIRRWHPGQDWILASGGFGVFDPAINAFSIATSILPDPIFVEKARIVVPAGRAAPIAATLALRSGAAPITVDLDFLQTGPQTWDIRIDTDDGALVLGMGGSTIAIAEGDVVVAPDREYPRLYARFAELIDTARSDVDIAPLRLVADALMVAERDAGPAFDW